MAALDILTKARARLVLNSPFFGSLALKLKFQEFDEPTMATDGYHLFYNSKFVEEMSFDETSGVLCHEVLHCALMHVFRRGDREPLRWNAAADYCINMLLLDEYNYKLPKDRLYDKKYKGMSAEEVYNLLEGSKWDATSWGRMMQPSKDGKPLDAAGRAQMEAEWKVSVHQAVQLAKQAGQGKDWFDELVGNMQPKIRWQDQLIQALTARSKTDYSWYPPDIQYVQRRLHVPTLSTPSLGKLVMAFDTSGSVSDKELAAFLAELRGFLDTNHCESLTYLHCDTEIRHEEEIDDLDDVTNRVYGRGGTYFQPVFERTEELGAEVLIYFTDLEPCGGFPDEPGYEVIWVRTQKKDAPYGRYVDLFNA